MTIELSLPAHTARGRAGLAASMGASVLAICCVLGVVLAPSAGSAQQPAATAARTAVGQQQTFPTPDAAFEAFVAAVRDPVSNQLVKILGPNFRQIIPIDQDDVEDLRSKFLAAYATGHKINMVGDGTAVLETGTAGWTMPVPLVKGPDGWKFDVIAGADEIRDRAIGRNELAVVQVLLAIVDAQKEYVQIDPMKTGVAQYARRLLSSPGKKDGLYWEQGPGDPESPLGDLVAHSQIDGTNRQEGYYGYHYRLLYGQGPNAPGGAYDYLVKERMIGGFGVIAWPVRYAETGIVTFMVNQDGVVYEKDLGPNTPAEVGRISRFDPDKSWNKADTTP
jgi:hypothetical protein